MPRTYQICKNCVMDTTDSNIVFDDNGICDYCHNFYSNILPHWDTSEQGLATLKESFSKIIKDGVNKEHDCLIGISGGVDSSYVVHLAVKYGLRPLLYHVDGGWNSKESVANIERLVDCLKLDLVTDVVNWTEMRDLQLAFFKAQVPHIDTPQDHAFFASLYNFAAKNGFTYILTGANYSTECVREPLEWHYHASDLRQLRDIHKKFGTIPLITFPQADIFKFKIYYRFIKGIKVIKPLNHVPFIKEDAIQELSDLYGWQKYAHKHYESRFTRFYEGYWLPEKFGFDKRRAHFSSLVLTGQMNREEALKKLSCSPYTQEMIDQDFEFISNKLDIKVDSLKEIMKGDSKSYNDYKSNMPLINLGTKILRFLGIQRAIIR